MCISHFLNIDSGRIALGFSDNDSTFAVGRACTGDVYLTVRFAELCTDFNQFLLAYVRLGSSLRDSVHLGVGRPGFRIQ